MQQSVAQFLRFRGGEFTVQEQVLGPGEQVDTGQREFQTGLVDGEDAGRESPEAGVFAGADAVFDPGVGAVAGF